MSSEQMFMDGMVDARLEKAKKEATSALAAKELAKERKDKAAKVFKMRSMRADYLVILEVIAKARAMSAEDPNIHYAVVDINGEGPAVKAAVDMKGTNGEYICYAVFLGGNEIEDFQFDRETLEYEESLKDTHDIFGKMGIDPMDGQDRDKKDESE